MFLEVEYNDTQFNTSSNDLHTGYVVENNKPFVCSFEPIICNVNSSISREQNVVISSEYVEPVSPELFCNKTSVIQLYGVIELRHREKKINEAMISIYSQFMDWAKEGEFELCDEFLKLFNPSNYDTRFLLSVLMASNPMKRSLSYRMDVFSKVKMELINRLGFEGAEEIMREIK